MATVKSLPVHTVNIVINPHAGIVLRAVRCIFYFNTCPQPLTVTLMNRLPIVKMNLLNLSSVSSVQIPHNMTNFHTFQPSVRLKRLNLPSTSTFRVPTSVVTNIFHNGPNVSLSPLKQTIVRHTKVKRISRSQVLNRRCGAYPNIYKCNSKRCVCCNILSTNSTIRSTVNNRVFSVKLAADIN